MRSMWNGSIIFGLVSIPIKLYSGSEEQRLELNMLDRRDSARIRYKRVNEKTGKEVEWQDIVKGSATEKGYILLEKEDFEQANLKKSKTIDIEEFVAESEVADVLFKQPYFMEPQKGGEKAYNLLREALKQTGKLGVATFVMREKEHLSLIGIYKKVLVLHLIRFAGEIRDPEELKLPDLKVTGKELHMAVSLIDQYTEPFQLDKYKDVYNEQLKSIIATKMDGKKSKVVQFDSKPTPARDLMAQLQASLAKKKNNKAA